MPDGVLKEVEEAHSKPPYPFRFSGRAALVRRIDRLRLVAVLGALALPS